tara:strand:+ start:49202 stop:50386 length:1185 start_codon:yes stop_codon:yes gene_type:complete
MKKIAFVMNAPGLGGAERSMVHQSLLLSSGIEKDYYLPFVNNESECKKFKSFLLSQNIALDNIYTFQFHSGLYKVSRSSKFLNIFSFIYGCFSSFNSLKRLNLESYDKVWCNGNKISVLLSLFIFIFRKDISYIWHWRDYPPTGGVFQKLIRFLNNRNIGNLSHIGNSFDVSKNLTSFFSNNKKTKVMTVYNPVGEDIHPPKNLRKGSYTIGIVSMFSDWKGVHNALLLFAMYENELKKLNISSIKVFGGEIYKTSGDHNNISKEYEKLLDKLDCDFISFEGLVDPVEIYAQVDCLFHCSNKKEPFGRVIVESFKAKVPVVSTSLGGSYELVVSNDLGWKVFPYDYKGQLQVFKNIFNNINSSDVKFLEKIDRAYLFSNELNSLVKKQLSEAIC